MGLWLHPKEAENMHSNIRNDSPLTHLEVFVGWALPTEMQQVYLLKWWALPTLRHDIQRCKSKVKTVYSQQHIKHPFIQDQLRVDIYH